MSSELYNESEQDRCIDEAIQVENIISSVSSAGDAQEHPDHSLYSEDVGGESNLNANVSTGEERATHYDKQDYSYGYASDNGDSRSYQNDDNVSHEGYLTSEHGETSVESSGSATATATPAASTFAPSKTTQQPGDWLCPNCGENNFASRLHCYKRACATPRPQEMMAGYKPHPAHRRDDRGRFGGYADRSRGDRERERDYRDSRGGAPGAHPYPLYTHTHAHTSAYGADAGRDDMSGRDRESLTWRSLDQKSIANAVNFGDAGDWLCDSCDNHNYASRDICKRCGRGHKSVDNQRAFDELCRRFGFLCRGDSKRSGMNARHGQRYHDPPVGHGYGGGYRDHDRDRRGYPSHGHVGHTAAAQAPYSYGDYGYGAPYAHSHSQPPTHSPYGYAAAPYAPHSHYSAQYGAGGGGSAAGVSGTYGAGYSNVGGHSATSGGYSAASAHSTPSSSAHGAYSSGAYGGGYSGGGYPQGH